MTIRRGARFVAASIAVGLAACLFGCYNTGTVILLPEKDGRDTAVEVKQGKDAYLLDKPYAAVRQQPAGAVTYKSDPKDVDARFGAALAAQPRRAESFTLNFEEGKDELTGESKRVFETVVVEITKYAVPDLVVVGHTDTVGTDQINDPLSLKRAEAVKTLLVARGIPAANIETVGRGKRELLVKTADQVAEPGNRRVEIVVR